MDRVYVVGCPDYGQVEGKMAELLDMMDRSRLNQAFDRTLRRGR